MRKIWMTAACAVALTMVACGGSNADTKDAKSEQPAAGDQSASDSDADAPKSHAELKAEFEKTAADNLAASEKFLADNAKRDGVKTTSSGLQYMVLEEGPKDGAVPVSTDLVTVDYVGTHKDGVEFDSSRAHGAAATFKLNQVIPGWTEGVQLMSEGDKFRFFMPPELAYGKSGTPGGPIGPNEALIFDVHLLKVDSPERNLAAAKKFLAENANKPGVKTTSSGLQYKVLVEGPADGATPTADSVVKVNYRGTLINGTEFDSSYARNEPLEFPLNRVIPGWAEGLQLMHVGEKCRFFIPPELAYGERGGPGGAIGPNEALVFDVELLDVK